MHTQCLYWACAYKYHEYNTTQSVMALYHSGSDGSSGNDGSSGTNGSSGNDGSGGNAAWYIAVMTFESTQILWGLKAALLALLKPQSMAYMVCQKQTIRTRMVLSLVRMTPLLQAVTNHGIDGFHSILSLSNWRALHHHAACWLVNIHITWHFCPPVSMVKDVMESIYR